MTDMRVPKDSHESIAASNVTSMIPTFPEVRCDECRHVYTVPTGESGIGAWVFGACPRCGAERFSTSMPSTTGAVVMQMAPCHCKAWEQRWKADAPERCVNCGGLFDPKTVPARTLRPGEAS